MNLIILNITGQILKVATNKKKYILAAVIESVILIIFLMITINAKININFLEIIISEILMIIIAYNECHIKEIILKMIVMTMVGFTIGGVFYAINESNIIETILNSITRKDNFKHNNILSILFVSLIMALAITIVIYIIREKGINKDTIYNVTINIKNKYYSFTGMVDTGNSLKEPFSGKPVCIVEGSILKQSVDMTTQGVMLIPYRAVGVNSGFLYAIKAEEVIIKQMNSDKVQKKIKDVYIAIYEGKLSSRYNMLLNREIMI